MRLWLPPIDPRLPLDRFLGGASPALGAVLGVLFIAGVAVVDNATGQSVSLAPFYLMPVLLVTWNAGRAWGITTAGLATVSSQLADVNAGAGDGLVPSWNAVVWFGVAVFVAWLLSALKDEFQSQGKRLVRQTERSADLEEQNDIKNTLLHAVSHDLKGPLSGVLGAIKTIRRRGELGMTDQQVEDLYLAIEQAGAKAIRLVDDLLDLDRLDKGTLRAERKPTDVVEVTERLTREIPALRGRVVTVAGDEILADVDGAKVERIIENLLNNAARHTPPGTPVWVDVHPRPDGVEILVEDEGPGVPRELREAIFEPFYQGDQARGGVGLGLSLVRRFAEIHGGTAWVTDRPGGGARFVVRLPCAVTSSVTRPATLHVV
jgi:signal transduction histidine kinase